MENKDLKELYEKMQKVHGKALEIFNLNKASSMLKNEFRNKVSQYDSMYDSIESMKAITDKAETMENLINQQLEILNVRIKWELDWAKRAL